MFPFKESIKGLIGLNGRRASVGGLAAAQKIQVLLYIAKEFAATKAIATLYETVIGLSAEIFEADNVVLRLWDGKALMPVKALDVSRKGPVAAGEGFAGRVFMEKKSLLLANLEKSGLLSDPTITTRSVLCVPIPFRDETLGTISLEKDVPSFFREEDQEILEAMASQLGLALNEVRLVEGLLKARQGLDNDLKMGRKVQSQIVPSQLPPWDGLTFGFHYEPKMEVSGDYFDVVLRDHSATVLMADVSGHGISAALVTMSIHHQFRQAVLEGKGLREIMEDLNRNLLPKLPEGTFFSAQLLRVTRDRRFSYVNAGHPRILHHHGADGTTETLDTEGSLIGIMDLARDDFEEKFGTLEAGDTLIFHTDGFAEQKDAAGKEIGEEGLMAWFGDIRDGGEGMDGPAMARGLVERFQGHSDPGQRSDDRTLLVVHVDSLWAQAESLFQDSRKALERGDRDFAYDRALEAHGRVPSHLQNLLHLANLYYDDRRHVEAEPYFSRYIDSVGDAGSRLSRRIGEVCYHSGKVARAKAELKKAIAHDRTDRKSVLLLAECYLKERAPKKASAVLKQAIKAFPMDDEMEALLGRVISKALLQGG